jgi:hypothetical protein
MVKVADQYTLFDMAEKHMFDRVMKKVKRDLLAQLEADLNKSYDAFMVDAANKIDPMLVEFATSEIKCMADHASMSDQYLIWLKRNDGPKEKV